MSAFAGVRAVSFDVGGTLIDPWPSVGHVYAAVAREAGLPEFDPVQLNQRFAAAWRAKVRFDYSRRAWAELVTSTFGGSAAEYGVDSALFERLYDRFTEDRAWRLYADVLPALQGLAARRFKLAAISNWDDRLRPLLRRLALDDYFQVITVSAECHCHKPDPGLFLRAAAQLALEPVQVLHVGDSQTEDFQGARGAGLRALLLKRNAPPQGPGEIGSLWELLRLLETPQLAQPEPNPKPEFRKPEI
jgi:putative hydrolase of the HAD superfamily